MALNDIHLGELGSEYLLSAAGRTFSKKRLEQGRKKRTLDGTLRRDIMSNKWEFTLDYSFITHNDYLILEGLYNLNEELSLKVQYPDEETTYTVMINPLSLTRAVAVRGGLWRDVQVVLEEV